MSERNMNSTGKLSNTTEIQKKKKKFQLKGNKIKINQKGKIHINKRV